MTNEYFDANISASINADFVDMEEVEIKSQEDLSPEDKIIKHQMYDDLSLEAKEVIDIIINTPNEILDAISTKSGKKSKKLLVKFLTKRWKSKFIVETVIQEITSLVKLF